MLHKLTLYLFFIAFWLVSFLFFIFFNEFIAKAEKEYIAEVQSPCSQCESCPSALREGRFWLCLPEATAHLVLETAKSFAVLCRLQGVLGAHLSIMWGSLCSAVLIPCARLGKLLPALPGDGDGVCEMKVLEVMTSFPRCSCSRHSACVCKQICASQELPEATGHLTSAL